jgi:hypothetical protein
MPSYYDLLGVPPDAPLSDIQAAYEMQRRHADWRGPADPTLLAQYHTAWRVLSDPVSRREYDQRLGLGSTAQAGFQSQWAPGQQWSGSGSGSGSGSQPQSAWGAGTAAPRSPGPGECCLCGSAPAAPGRLRAHQGLILLMRFRHFDGPFCRDCGLAVFRDMTARTLLQGWWGLLSFFITIGIVVKNAVLRGRFASLGAPRRDLAVQAPNGRPLDPGKPLLQRPAALGLLIPLLLLGLAVFAIRSDRPEAQVGKCVRISGENAELVSCSERHDGQVISVADTLEQCPEEASGALRRDSDSDKVLCVVTGR